MYNKGKKISMFPRFLWLSFTEFSSDIIIICLIIYDKLYRLAVVMTMKYNVTCLNRNKEGIMRILWDMYC